MSKAYECDRCGMLFKPYKNQIKIGDCLDLCPKCNDKLQEWVENGKVQVNYTDSEIANSFIEDVEAVKDLLPQTESEGNMEIVIKISEEVKNRLCFGVTYPEDIQVMCEALNNGTPLPKGHGRLIDVDDLEVNTGTIDDWSERDFVYLDEIEDAPTIIEADKESEVEE